MTAVWLALLLARGLMAQHVNLEGTWKWKAGDDPGYAQPSFDDSAWSDYELPRRGDVPAGVSWLRRSVRLPLGGIPDPALAIGLVSGCYEVSVNGTKVGDSGCRPEAEPPVPDTHAFSVPAKLLTAEIT